MHHQTYCEIAQYKLKHKPTKKRKQKTQITFENAHKIQIRNRAAPKDRIRQTRLKQNPLYHVALS